MGEVMNHAVVILGALGFALSVVTFSGLTGENLVVLTVGCLLLGMAAGTDAPWRFKAASFLVVAVLATMAPVSAERYWRRREGSW